MRIKRLFRSFRDAGRGVSYVFNHEQNFRVQIFFALLVIFSMFVFKLRRSEIVVVILLIILVLVLELINSILEKFIDLVKPRLDLQAKVIKDIAAAMVLLASIGALIIGSIIFWPYLASYVW